jgi:hypothetical protein
MIPLGAFAGVSPLTRVIGRPGPCQVRYNGGQSTDEVGPTSLAHTLRTTPWTQFSHAASALRCVLVGWRCLERIAYYQLVRHTTVLHHLARAGEPRMDGKFSGDAVIAGGRCGALVRRRISPVDVVVFCLA